jgi:hypothetical protein
VTQRYILRFQGRGEAPSDDVSRIERAVRVIERTPRMLLVESTPARVNSLVAALPGWSASEERSVPVPDARPAVRPAAAAPAT